MAQQARPQNEVLQATRPYAAQQEAPPQGIRLKDVRRMIEDGLAQRRPDMPRYTRPYSPEIDWIPLPRNYRLPEFMLFSGDGQTSSIEHIGRFTAQCGEADSDAQRLRLFVHSLTGAAFSWFINLPPNSIRDWSDMERREFVKMAEEGLEFEYRKKFQGIEFRDMHDLTNKVDRYASLLKEEMQKKTASKGTYYRNPIISYAEADGSAEAEGDEVEMSSAEVSIDKPFVCRGLAKTDNSLTKIPDASFRRRRPCRSTSSRPLHLS
ncbi:uncharacterized protein LOC110771847 [Prunus avium]|uniref:Uncharacterized protein LOC110771847 n=1 Tax=Prunus avium TaxID=42229 RepID=A0A6P5TXW5_PRUAV|nr:uncharacterized protein LOC110771847 [Prunus avium]